MRREKMMLASLSTVAIAIPHALVALIANYAG